jgi:uncharacterized protein (TIGR03382 family)
VQTLADGPWFGSDWFLHLRAMTEVEGPPSVVVVTSWGGSFFGWDPATETLDPEGMPYGGYGWGVWEAGPGPFSTSWTDYEMSPWGVNLSIWGWSPPDGLEPHTLPEDDPRVEDCFPPQGTDPSTPAPGTTTATDTGEAGTGAARPDRSACGCTHPGDGFVASLMGVLFVLRSARRRHALSAARTALPTAAPRSPPRSPPE